MNPARDFLDRIPGEQPVIARERIGLDIAAEVLEQVEWRVLAPTSGELIGDQRLLSPMTSGIDPEPGLDRGVAARIVVLERQDRVVREHMAAREHLRHHPPVQILQELAALHEPVGHQGVGQLDAEPLQPSRDPVERQPVRELADDQERDQAGRGHALGERLALRESGALDHPVAGVTGVLLAPRLDDLDRGRDVSEVLARLVAKMMQRAAAAAADLVCLRDIDDVDLARQVLEDPNRLLALRWRGARDGNRSVVLRLGGFLGRGD